MEKIIFSETSVYFWFQYPSVGLTAFGQTYLRRSSSVVLGFDYFLVFNPLNAELNPVCHLLVLLGDFTFMGPCIVSIFQYTYISNKMQRYTVYLYLETALHVSGGTSTHKERTQLYLQHLVFVTPLLLSAAIVEELEPV
jgi:hypothetical protein